VDRRAAAGQAERVTSPSSFRPLRWGRRDDVAMNVMRATQGVNGPDGQPVDLPEALPGSAYQCRLGVFRKTIVLWFVAPPEPSRLENAQRAAGEWRVKVRVNPKGRPPLFFEGGGTAGVRAPRRPGSPSGSGQVEAQEPAD
jgi:hypothetical protein